MFLPFCTKLKISEFLNYKNLLFRNQTLITLKVKNFIRMQLRYRYIISIILKKFLHQTKKDLSQHFSQDILVERNNVYFFCYQRKETFVRTYVSLLRNPTKEYSIYLTQTILVFVSPHYFFQHMIFEEMTVKFLKA